MVEHKRKQTVVLLSFNIKTYKFTNYDFILKKNYHILLYVAHNKLNFRKIYIIIYIVEIITCVGQSLIELDN